MKYIHKNQLSFFFIPALCITYTKIISMEESILYKPLFSKQLADVYQSPFTKEYKQKLLTDHMLPKKSKGFFQAYIAYSATIDLNEKNDYLLYKTMQYALKTHKQISIAPITNDSNTILKSFDKICNLISFFKTKSNKYPFTPHIRFNILFYLALLQDMAHNRQCYYSLDQTLYANIYDMIPDATTILPKQIDDLNKHFNPFIDKVKDEANCVNNIKLSELIAFFNQTDTIILPVSNKDGSIDINTFLYFLPKKFILVGIGNQPVFAHGKQLTSLTDLAIHDILHACIQLIANQHNINNYKLCEPYNTFREKFFILLEQIIKITNTCYQEALSENNTRQASLMSQYQFILFIILHETIHSYQFYDPKVQKARFKDGLMILLKINDFKKLKPNDYTNQKVIEYFLFNSLDMLNTVCFFNPRIKKAIDELGLCISPTKIERHNKSITNKELKKIIDTFIINKICDIFTSFFTSELYKNVLDKTIFPFMI